jgi:hypothetical protein
VPCGEERHGTVRAYINSGSIFLSFRYAPKQPDSETSFRNKLHA